MGVAAKMVGVATTTTAAGVTAHRVLVCLRAPPRGQLRSDNRGSWPQLWQRNGARGRSAWDGSSTSSRSSSCSSTDHSEVVVVAGKKCQEPWQEEHLPEAFTLLLRLLITHFDGVDTEEGYTKLHTFGMCNGMPFSDFSGALRTYADRYAE